MCDGVTVEMQAFYIKYNSALFVYKSTDDAQFT